MTTMSKPGAHYDSGRPDVFSKIVGNKSTVTRLARMVQKNQLPKALLLTGPTGSGKTTLARIIARAILCANRGDGEFEPCGTCKHCQRPLNDTTCSEACYSEYDANAITTERMLDFPLEFQHPWEVLMIDELQDLASEHLRRMRKLVEGTQATLIFTTSHPDQLEDAFRNRLKSFEFEMKRPTKEEVADYLERQFAEQSVRFLSREQLLRVAEELNCEMRPCSQFPLRVLAEFEGILTDECLDELFGEKRSTERTIGHTPYRFGAI